MSTQYIVAAVGAVVGGYVGSFFGATAQGAQWGWALGGAVGASMAPNQKVQGPKLADLKATGVEYGQPIPWLQGHPRVAPQVWWSSDRREIATTVEQGGKGGGGTDVTTYTYEVDMLLGLSDNEIVGVSRVWQNGKLVYNTLSSADSGTVAASVTTDLWKRITVYTGSATQMPDPAYEAAVGTANAPAYRGRGSVFIEGLQLGGSGQIPNLTFEVLTKGDVGFAYDQIDPLLSIALTNNDIPCTIGHRVGKYKIMVANTSTGRPLKYWDVEEAQDGTIELVSLGQIGTFQTAGTIVAGNSDQSCFVLNSGGGTNVLRVIEDDATWADYNIGSTFSTWGRRNGVVVGRRLSDGKIVRADTLAASAAGGYVANHIAVGTDKCFALRGSVGPLEVYVFDLSTMALLQTIATPAGGSANLFCDEHDNVYVTSGTAFWRLDVTGWTAMPSPGSSGWGTAGGYSSLNLAGGYLYTTSAGGPSATFTNKRLMMLPTYTLRDESLADVVSRLCLRAGLTAGQFDVTALASIAKPVRAFAVSQVCGTRACLDILASAYFFECVGGDKLYFRPRGSAPVATIPWADLGASMSPEGDAETLALKLNNELEIPAEVALSYINVDKDYNTDTQVSDRLLTAQGSTSNAQLPLAFTASEAKGIADAMVADQGASIVSTRLALPHTYARLEPTDVVLATGDDGSQYRLRLIKRADASGLLSFDAVLDDASVLTSAGVTSTDYIPSTTVNAPAQTLLEVLDIPILRDADNSPGHYGVCKGSSPQWPGAVIFGSANDVDFVQAATVTEAAIFGVATTTLGAWTGGNVFDETNTLTVDVGNGQLASSTRDALLSDETINSLLVGAEIIRFVDAALLGPGVYQLARLLRGQRGTEWAAGGHAAAERVVLLRNAGARRLPLQAGQINVPLYWRGVSIGRKLSTATSKQVTNTGIGLKPHAPVDARVARDAGNDCTIRWARRTRLSHRFLSPGIDAPLGETSEAYVVEIYSSASFLTLVRSISATGPASYTAAQQTSDGLTPGDPLNLRIYQVSAVVGRGYLLQAIA